MTKRERWSRWLALIALTAAATAVLAFLGVPSPALFGGLLAATVLALAGWAPGDVYAQAGVASQAVIGVVIGVMARPDALGAVAQDWLPVLSVGLATLAVSMGAGMLMGIHKGVTPLTGMLSLTAGGASGLVAISRELGGDERVVAVVQYLRVGLVTATMPVIVVLAFGTTFGATIVVPEAGAGLLVDAGFLVVCGVAGVALARLTRMPAGAMLGPMIVTLTLSLTGFSFGAHPPDLIVEIAYVVIGWQAGLRFTQPALRMVISVLPLAAALIVGVIVACAGLGVLLSVLTGASLLDGYLATSPGGVYAVLATAISSGGDVAFVMAGQVVRVVVMLLVAPAMARLLARWTM